MLLLMERIKLNLILEQLPDGPKKSIIKLWKGDNWDQVKDFCTLTGIKPKEVLAWAASRRLDKTDKKTVLIKAAYSRIKIKA